MPTWDSRQPAELTHELSQLKLSDTSIDLVLSQGGTPGEIGAITRGLGIVRGHRAKAWELETIALTVSTYPKLRILGDTSGRDTEDRQELMNDILGIIGVTPGGRMTRGIAGDPHGR